MAAKMNRRSFIKNSAVLGMGTLVSTGMIPGFAKGKKEKNEPVDLSVTQGQDYFKNTVAAIAQLGGMNRFVPKGAKVALLANPQRNNPGAFTSPQVLAAVIRMCKEAGALSITCISWLPQKNWESTGLKDMVDKEGAILKITDMSDESLFKPVPIPNGLILKEARIMNELFQHDLLINIPITKDHAGNKFTGTLKNMMGLNSPLNNRTFHKPNWQTDINDIHHLDQCIADLNTVITPALNIVDATEFIITNGPFGPGTIHKPQKIVAGTDRVAIDAFCCTLWDLNATDIHTITSASKHKLGQINLKKVKIKETSVT